MNNDESIRYVLIDDNFDKTRLMLKIDTNSIQSKIFMYLYIMCNLMVFDD